MNKSLSFDMFLSDNQHKDSTHSSISEFPGDFIKDVDCFIEYCATTKTSLTKTTKTLSRKDLQNLNEQVHVKAYKANAYSSQESYPYIDFIFRLMLSSRLFDIPTNSRRFIPEDIDRLTAFKNFTLPEKYCFLLETFWVDMDWNDLMRRYSPIDNYVAIFSIIYPTKSNKKYNLRNPKNEIEELLDRKTNHNWLNFYSYFEWFGLWMCEPDTELMNYMHMKNTFIAKSIAVTQLGKQIMPILIIDRHLHIWNIALRKQYDISQWTPGLPIHYAFDYGMSVKDIKKLETVSQEDQSRQPFYLPFTPLFTEGTLQQTFPRAKSEFKNGAYTLRITYDKDTWRIVKLPATATMEDLHYEILYAYDFEDDHLYSFFIDGKKWSDLCIACPYEDSGRKNASEIQIGSIGMIEDQPIVYVFDYAAEWTFTILLENIDEQNTDNFEPFLFEEVGDDPQQYPFSEEYEEEDDEEDEW